MQAGIAWHRCSRVGFIMHSRDDVRLHRRHRRYSSWSPTAAAVRTHAWTPFRSNYCTDAKAVPVPTVRQMSWRDSRSYTPCTIVRTGRVRTNRFASPVVSMLGHILHPRRALAPSHVARSRQWRQPSHGNFHLDLYRTLSPTTRFCLPYATALLPTH